MHAVPGLACPACRGDLRADGESSLSCQGCAAVYPILDGIPSFVPAPTPTVAAELPGARQALSRTLSRVLRRGLSLPYSDLSSGYRLYRREAVAALELHATGFDILQEVLIRMVAAGYEIREVPLRYRALGTSRAW